MYKTFPKVSEIVSKDTLRPSMTYAVVLDNKLIATDSCCMIMLKTSTLVPDAEQEQNISGKVFSRDLLLLLQKAKRLIFLEDKISVDGVYMDYSGTITPEGDVYLAGSEHKEFRYPNYKGVIPSSNPTEIDSINFDPKLMAKIIDCFSSITVQIKFYGKNRGMMVFNTLDSDQQALCMPTTSAY